MQLKHSFTVPVSVDTAWEVLLDIERVAPCMPGAVLDSVDGDSFTGRVKIKLGPVNLTYKGAASFVEKDAEAHRVVLDASGKDARGNGTAAAKVTATLVGQGESTDVQVVTDLNITGKPAQFGRGVMVDVGNKLIGQFATCLEGKLTGEPEPAPEAVTPPEAVSESEPATTPELTAQPAQQEVPAEDSGAATHEADSSPATTAPSSAAASAPVPAVTAPRPIREPGVEPQPIDLLELAGGSVLTRVAPIAGGALVLAVLVWLVRRRR